MRYFTLSRLALLGLASAASVAFAVTTHGQVRFDTQYTLNHDKEHESSVADRYEKAAQLHISRARLDFSGEVAQDWAYHVRAQYFEHENDQIGLEPSQITQLQNQINFTVNSEMLREINATIARAYLSWSGIEGLSVNIGRIGTPEVTSDRLYYRPYIGQNPNDRTVGSVTNYSGDHPGFSFQGAAGPVGYTFGLWKQTDFRKLLLDTTKVDNAFINESDLVDFIDEQDRITLFVEDFFKTGRVDLAQANSFDSKSLRIGFAFRLNFSQELQNGAAIGLGLGYNQAPLNMPIYGIAVAQLPLNFQLGEETPQEGAERATLSYAYGLATYKEMSNLAIDLSARFKSFQANAGYQYQQMKSDSVIEHSANRLPSGAVPSEGATVRPATSYNFLEKNGSAQAFWVELGYLVIGDSYRFCHKNGVVSGVKLREKQAGLEVTARYGTEHRKNMLALLSPTGWSDFNTYADGKTDAGATRARADIISVPRQPTNTALAVQISNGESLDDTSYAYGQLGFIERAETDDFFETKMTGFALNANYYMTENAILKIEYEHRHHEFKRPNAITVPGNPVTSWRDSAFNKNVGTLRVRADYTF